MTLFMILAPYGAFAMLMLFTSAAVSMFTAAAICLMAIAYDILRGHSIKMLGAGSVIVFVAIGFYLTMVDSSLSNSAVNLAVDAGVLAISLVSLAIRRPFTLQYAREVVDAETAASPGFVKAGYIITWAWAAALLLMLLANVLMIYVPVLPLWSGLAIAFAARNTAMYFTKWYPQYRKSKYGPLPGHALPGAR
jgi:hypothetical protein